MNKLYPTVIDGFNVYRNGNALIGVSDEVQLPEFAATTASISGAGILGTFDAPVLGHFGSMDQVIPFRTLAEDVFSIMDPSQTVDLTLRGSVQYLDLESGATSNKGMRVVFRGLMKSFTPGSVKAADEMKSSVTLSLTYILIEVDGKTMIELDKFNGVYKINGVDCMAKIKSYT